MDHQKRDSLSFSIEKLLSCDGCTKTTKLKHRRRSSFSALQVHWLENEFRCHRYISPERRAGLAALLGLTQQQIKIWFQNRRYKTKFRQNGKTTNLETKLNPQNLMASVTGQELMKYFIRPQIWNNYYCNLAEKSDLKSEEPKVADTTEDQNKSNEIFDLM